MKKIVFALIITLLITGCNRKETNDDSTIQISKISIDKTTVINVLDNINNIAPSEYFRLELPENLDHISAFTYGWGKKQSNKEFYNDYIELFKYLFPDHKLDESILRYYGKNSQLEFDENGKLLKHMNIVKDYYDSIVSDIEDVHHFYYDESAEFGADHTKDRVCALFANPLCGNLSNFNKGKTVKIASQNIPLEIFNPAEYFEYIETCSPDSEKSYKLSDGYISIKDAVSNYESYINNLPYPSTKTDGMRMNVVSVDVFKVTDSIFGYSFQTSREYEGIPFDYMRSGTHYSGDYGYDTDIGSGFMIESKDVDQTYGIYLTGTVNNKKDYTEIVSFESAANLISTSLTQSVKFKLEKAELVYCMKSFKGDNQEIDNIMQETAAAWKFTLFNPSDNLTYVCYIDAVNGENFRYYTTA